MAPHALGAVGGLVLAAPEFSTCADRCARELSDRRSMCEAQSPEPEKADAYKGCLLQAKELAGACETSCGACSNACLSKMMACAEDCPCGESGPCLTLCKNSFPKCYEYCGLAVELSSVDLAPPTCPSPEPAEQAAPAEEAKPAEEPKPVPEEATPVEVAPPPVEDAPAPSDE